MGKRLKAAGSLVAKEEFSIADALDGVLQYGKSFAAKFDETVEVVFKLGLDAKQSDLMIRGSVSLPHGSGKEVRVAVIADPSLHDDAKKAGAVVVGSDDLIADIKAGKMEFDICITTPSMMPKVAVLGKVLGPRGLMPNPKLGTVTSDVAAAVKDVMAGKMDYRLEKGGLIHGGVGKLSFTKEALMENVQSVYQALLSAKPSGAKGVYMQKFHLSTSQGPSFCINLKSMEL